MLNGRIRLNFDLEQLVPYWIQEETPAIAWDWLRVKGYLRLKSTNSEALNIAKQGAPTGTLIISEEQTSGRGRKNHIWHSAAGAGLYYSLILRPRQSQKYWPILTLAASVALVDALRDLNDSQIIPIPLDIDIKWPNDVLLSGKKCAGILLETLLNDAENPAAIVGVGVNFRKGSVPEFLASEAVSLDEMAHTRVPRRRFLVQFLYFFQLCYLLFEEGKHAELLERWKRYSSMWHGAPIWIGNEEMSRQAVTCGLNDLGALIVRTKDGTLETLFAESIRLSRGTR
jgi:BirA family biotin operon repressor/biotin-[acetyl-CoA-carboxylase] ligase